MTVLLRYVSLFLLSLLILFLPLQAVAETNIINIRNWAAPDHTRIVIDATEDPVYQVTKEGKKISIELDDAVYSKTLNRQFPLKKPGIDKVVVTPRPEENQVLIELFLTEHTETKVFKLQQIDEKPFRIVVDIVLPEIEKKESAERERVKITSKKKIIVIDPGHGGDDPGAVGRQGTYEKNIVLAVSRKIRDNLNKRRGYRAFLTRDDDYYVPFKKRLKIAREYHADLFISIHADAEKSRQAAGSSVYALSLKSASSEAARILARKENLADIVGGVANGEVTKDESDPIILNMFQTNTLNASKTFGSTLLTNLSAINRIKFASVQEAPFMVLKLPEIPSVLIETAFLSHPREEKMLRSPKFQKEIAEMIADSAVEFLEAVPGGPSLTTVVRTEETPKVPPAAPPLTSPAKAEELPKMDIEKQIDRKVASRTASAGPAPVKGRPLVVSYKVKKGDALERIARKYGVTVAAIVELNDISMKKPLYVDRKLKIPVSVEDEEAPPVKKAEPLKKSEPEKKPEVSEKKKKKVIAEKHEKQAKKFYLVKKGDTLESIARKNKTTISALKKVNGAKKLSPLYADQKLEIPGH